MKCETYYETNYVELYNNDFIGSQIEKNSIDLIVTSPPYNLKMAYDIYSDNLTINEYMVFSNVWLNRCIDVLKDDGRICVVLPLTIDNPDIKGAFYGLYAIFLHLMCGVGFNHNTTIIWRKFSKPKMTAWGSWMSPSAPYVVPPVEMIVVGFKKQWKKKNTDRESDILRQEFIEWTEGMWKINGETTIKGHPAPFPLEIPIRLIKLYSFVGDTILDPFVGSGTTLVACELLKRKGIGFDISENYCRLSKNRIRDIRQINLDEF
jgi:site-specific DNA-methyltransferase (adenine-specific)